jgi:hypothetical protein
VVTESSVLDGADSNSAVRSNMRDDSPGKRRRLAAAQVRPHLPVSAMTAGRAAAANLLK